MLSISHGVENGESLYRRLHSIRLHCHSIHIDHERDSRRTHPLFPEAVGLYGGGLACGCLDHVQCPLVSRPTNIMVFLGRATRFRYWLPACLYASLIFLLSHQSDPPGAQVVPDYIAHFFEYALFGLTLSWGATSGFHRPLTSKTAVLLGVIAALNAIGDEFHQSFVPDRVASVGDLAVDILGASACVGVVWVRRRGKWR